ncbi:MAG: NAD-dependent epimerase/dehydratase family protein [Pseudomonadota bacterium]
MAASELAPASTPAPAPALESWVVVGCGYVGERLAACLVSANPGRCSVAGDAGTDSDSAAEEQQQQRLGEKGEGGHVVAVTHQREHASELARRLPRVDVRVADAFCPETLATVLPMRAMIVDCVAPVRGRSPHEPGLVAAAARAQARRIVYVSATSVYPRGDGGWIDEDTPPLPDTPRGKLRLESENALLEAAAASGIETVILRVAAIYGPGRGVHERIRVGQHWVVGDGANWFSRIHVDDLVGVIVASATIEPLPRRVYLVADDEPTTARQHCDGIAALLGVPPPPHLDASRASNGSDQCPTGTARSGQLSLPGSSARDPADIHLGSRRVSNRRLKSELGIRLLYPSWRQGVPASIAETTALRRSSGGLSLSSASNEASNEASHE